MDELHIEGKPVPKGRAVPILVNGRVKMVPHSPTRTYENRVGKAWKDAGLPKHEGPIAVHILVHPDGVDVTVDPLDAGKSLVRGDVDNFAKSVLDGLNGVAWDDDRQVYALSVAKVCEH